MTGFVGTQAFIFPLRSVSLERVQALYTAITSNERKLDILKALAGEPWEKALKTLPADTGGVK